MKSVIPFLLSAAFCATGCATSNLSGHAEDSLLGVGLSLPTVWDQSDGGVDLSPSDATQIAWLQSIKGDNWAALVREAYRNNPDLDLLRANLERADALSQQARAGLLPVLNGLLGAARTDLINGEESSTANLNASLSVSWEPDLWGRLGARSEARDLERYPTIGSKYNRSRTDLRSCQEKSITTRRGCR